MTARVSDKDTRENIRKIFNLFDDEKTGFISIKNLRRVAKELGETIDDSELQEMIERADTDNDGLVSEEEFYNIITKKTFAAWLHCIIKIIYVPLLALIPLLCENVYNKQNKIKLNSCTPIIYPSMAPPGRKQSR